MVLLAADVKGGAVVVATVEVEAAELGVGAAVALTSGRLGRQNKELKLQQVSREAAAVVDLWIILRIKVSFHDGILVI